MGRMGERFRIEGHAKCTLHFAGLAYVGEIDNISLSGALVKLGNSIPECVRPGCACGLTLGRTDVYPVRYACRVARLAPDLVGVQILELIYGGRCAAAGPHWLPPAARNAISDQ
ncbi:PilZ domain-containing protein [Geobacter sp. FeAm09]|uniref:PilZ domain-containing protein n=1 Tax=Geobacter sp. FeAm09 TaxID=2597769 RepID=UPI0011EF7F9A|nr:PilZ domain-containing protein [Geobacter sp. FeAm09]QEM67509.1 PilZ domain-containing protein [Geobacter sp. FeAm09]